MHNFIGLRQKYDNFRKGVFIDPYDEPSFLTFAIDFNFDGVMLANDADSLLESSPLFNDSKDDITNSAQKFLTARGYAPQANGLKTFKEILRYLTFQAPWYFQSISGLDNLWKNATEQKSGYKAFNTKVTVNTMEAVDLRMTEIADLYRNAIYDKYYMRERIPDNLRWFSMDIYLAEYRNLRYRLPGATQSAAQFLGVNTAALGNIVGGGNQLSNVMKDYGYIKFKCRQCEFDFSNSLPNYTGVGETSKMATSKFDIKIGYFEEENSFGDGSRTFDKPSKTDVHNPWGKKNIGVSAQNVGTFLSGIPGVGQGLANATDKIKDGLSSIGGLINPALNAASNFIETGNTAGKISLGDSYSTGYASNGDTPPKPGPEPKGNVY